MLHCEHCGEERPFHATDCGVPLILTAIRLPVDDEDDQ